MIHWPLFAGIEPQAMGSLLACVGAREVKYPSGSRIVEEGERVQELGVLLSGRGRAVKTDEQGRVVLISLLYPGSVMGVLLAASAGWPSPVSVEAGEDSAALLIGFDRLMSPCAAACPGHGRLLRNVVEIIAQKGLMLHERIDCLVRPAMREKIMAYLTRAAAGRAGRVFRIPMDRAAMAEYLNVDRSALSRELSAMRRDGLIDFHKNRFTILPNG